MIIYYAYGGSDNHGCEAIIRGTSENVRDDALLYSGNAKADKYYGLNNVCEIKSDSYKRYYHPAKWFIFKIMNTVFKFNTVFMLIDGKEKGIYLSVGGDNYCYPKLLTPVLAVNQRIRKCGNKTVLWGTSIEPEVLNNPQILADILNYDLIFARESITYEALLKYGLEDKAFLYPDPAFAMKPKEANPPDGLFDQPVVGINISPLILKYADAANAVKQGYIDIIKYVIENTDYNIALIPHVLKRNNNDLEAIQQLSKEISNKRIFMVQDNSADKLKYYISKCEFFMGARTHSTIAAYATSVPTLVIGYSIKARGIAKDIFGTEEGYVVDVRSLKDKNIMVDAFINLFSKRNEIREYLESFIPAYKERTVEGAKILQQYLNKWRE